MNEISMHTDKQTRLPGGISMGTETAYKGKLQRDVSMAKHCSWRTGGRVKQFYVPLDVEDLCHFIADLPGNESLLWLGLGSNLLVRDRGFDGTVIAVTGVLDDMDRINSHSVRVEAGVPCPKVARYCSTQGLAGAEFLVGIPGTMGGALAMNAGAFGGETWDIVVSVETVDRSGLRHIRQRQHFDIAYRKVHADTQEWFLAAELHLHPDTDNKSAEKMREWLSKRSETQPTGQASCGSVFRNPANDYAARLIEACGLKGQCVGQACVSEKHANFIINKGQASASDIEALIRQVQQIVKDQQGIELQTEVCIVGNL